MVTGDAVQSSATVSTTVDFVVGFLRAAKFEHILGEVSCWCVNGQDLRSPFVVSIGVVHGIEVFAPVSQTVVDGFLGALHPSHGGGEFNWDGFQIPDIVIVAVLCRNASVEFNVVRINLLDDLEVDGIKHQSLVIRVLWIDIDGDDGNWDVTFHANQIQLFGLVRVWKELPLVLLSKLHASSKYIGPVGRSTEESFQIGVSKGGPLRTVTRIHLTAFFGRFRTKFEHLEIVRHPLRES